MVLNSYCEFKNRGDVKVNYFIFSLIGYTILIAFICDLQKQINAMNKNLESVFNKFDDESFKLLIKNCNASNDKPPYSSK